MSESTQQDLDPAGSATAAIGLLETPDSDEADAKQLDAFLKLSGYKKEDVIGSSKARQTFSTSNGGKYFITKSGRKIRIVSGPAYPKLREEAEEDEE